MIRVISAAQATHDPGQSGVQIEQEGKQHAERDHVEEGRQQLSGQELPHLIDLGDPVHGLARRVALEILERQAQQAVEEMQVQLGVQPGADHRDDQPAGIAQQRVIGEDDNHDRAEQDERRHAVELQHLVDHGHHDQRGEDRQDADGERGERDIAQRLSLLEHEIGQPAEVELRIGRDMAAGGAQQHDLARPDLRQPELVHGHRRRLDRGAGVLQEDDMLLGVHARQQGGAAILEQQHDRGAILQPEQMAPADPHGPRPQAGILRPEERAVAEGAVSPVIGRNSAGLSSMPW